jgi:hypothetical protein
MAGVRKSQGSCSLKLYLLWNICTGGAGCIGTSSQKIFCSQRAGMSNSQTLAVLLTSSQMRTGARNLSVLPSMCRRRSLVTGVSARSAACGVQGAPLAVCRQVGLFTITSLGPYLRKPANCIFSAACSSPRSNLASHSLPRSNLLFYVTLLSPISCILPPCRNPAARNNFFSSHLIYLRTTHYFIHLNSSNNFVILLPSSHLALAFCSFISLPCCNHATRNNFYSNRLIHFCTTHSLYPQCLGPRPGG